MHTLCVSSATMPCAQLHYVRARRGADSVQCLLQCWDIGGQNIGSKMLRQYIYGAHAVVLAYDITNSESMANLQDWLDEVLATFGASVPYLALMGNKSM
ncbi:hypothetical protein EON66_02600 [archaeon]|nr:MAG: hypothetical protein EON66_02600 [archaeon]